MCRPVVLREEAATGIAAPDGRDGCGAQLIAAGADINTPNRGETPLQIAIEYGKAFCAALLRAAGPPAEGGAPGIAAPAPAQMEARHLLNYQS